MIRSIRSKILSSQLLIALFATLSLGLSTYLINTSYLKNTEREKCEFIAKTWAENLGLLIKNRRDLIKKIAKSDEVEVYSYTFRPALIQQYLRGFAEEFPVIAFLAEDGTEEIRLAFGKTYYDQKMVSETIENARNYPNTVFLKVVTEKPSSSQIDSLLPPYLEFAFNNNIFGEFAGIIVAQIPITPSSRDFANLSEFSFEDSGFVGLFDSHGTTILHRQQANILKKISIPKSLTIPSGPSDRLDRFRHETIHGINGFTAYSMVPGSNLIVSATLPYSQFMKLPIKLRDTFLVLGTLVILVCFLLSAKIAKGIATPILNLAEIANRLAKGDWNQKIEIKSKDETAQLGKSFIKMSNDFRAMITARDNEIQLRKKVEQAIKMSHLDLDQIFNSSAGGMVVIDKSHDILRVNDTFLDMFGIKRRDVVGRKCHDVFPDSSCGSEHCILDRTVTENRKIELEVEKKQSNGKQIVCRLTAMPFVDINGKVVGIIEDFRDITKDKRNEGLVKMSEQRYRLLFNSAPDGISVLNDQGIIIDCNQSTANIYKRSKPEIIGRHFTAFNTPESTRNCFVNFKKIKEKEHAEGEVHITAPDGQELILWRKGTKIQDANGYFSGVMIYDRDISKQKEIEELREDMARIAKHDLKGPLNGIINLPSLIKIEENLTGTQLKRLNLIEDAGYKMLTMINSSLDLFKMEKGSYKFNPVPVDICPIINKIKEELWADMQANQSRIELFLNGNRVEKYSFMILGEELLCYSMLVNLIKNSVESSPRNNTITVYLNNNGNMPEIKIHNLGQVPEEIYDDFFNKYTTAGKDGGTGLGTYSARLMARTQHGDITMHSSTAEGTTITVTLPSAFASQVAPALADISPEKKGVPSSADKQIDRAIGINADATIKNTHILLAEDDPINQTLATALLQNKGFLVTTASNGQEALDLLKSTFFDIILMDMQMPVLDGLATTKIIREQEAASSSAKIPIIAITGMSSAKQNEKIYAAGVDSIIPKPLDIDLLWETIVDILKEKQLRD